MMLQNLHTHTVFGDGKNTAEEMVLGAIACGCASLGFSEHSPLPPADDPDHWTMAQADITVYRQEVLRLREKYAGQLKIFLGLEQDFESPAPSNDWDYLIGSVHNIRHDGCYLSVDNSLEDFVHSVQEHFCGDSYAFAEEYYRREASVAEKTGCQIVGHFDLVTKFNEGDRLFDTSHPRYVNAAMNALETLLKKDILFEINTGAMSRGYRTAPYPASFLLRAIHKKGGRICITSDSHSAESITFAFDQARELARTYGFQEAWVLTEKGFVPQKL